MNSGLSFEYYSTIAPLGDAFLAAEPIENQTSAYKILMPLHTIDKGYQHYHTRDSKKSTYKKG